MTIRANELRVLILRYGRTCAVICSTRLHYYYYIFFFHEEKFSVTHNYDKIFKPVVRAAKPR